MLNISLKNIRKLPLTATLCVALLAACGGGGGGNTTATVSADQAAFNAVLVRYDAAGTAADPAAAYAAAIADFTTFKNGYSTSGRVDDADYYIARSKHELALLPVPVDAVNNLAAALAAYTTLAASTSNKADNAQFYIGKMRYDKNTSADYTAAIAEFNKVLAYASPSAGDDAQYYIGRSRHELALIAQITAPGEIATLNLFNDARTAYSELIKPGTIYSLSTRQDDAQYQIGKTYYDTVGVGNAPVPANYETAITELGKVVNYGGTAASSADNAQYFKARSIHERALLATPPTGITLAEARIQYLELAKPTTVYPLSTRRDDAQYQIGKTHFDAGDFDLALPEFEAVLTTPFTTATVKPSVGDDAQFYKARSMHELVNNQNTFVVGDFDAPRAEYAKVTLANFPLTNRVDDAEYYSAFTYHDSTQCNTERTAMTAFRDKYTDTTSPVFRPLAVAEIADLVGAPNGTHSPCI